jgi:hypothetical protein
MREGGGLAQVQARRADRPRLSVDDDNLSRDRGSPTSCTSLDETPPRDKPHFSCAPGGARAHERRVGLAGTGGPQRASWAGRSCLERGVRAPSLERIRMKTKTTTTTRSTATVATTTTHEGGGRTLDEAKTLKDEGCKDLHQGESGGRHTPESRRRRRLGRSRRPHPVLRVG